MPIVDAKIEHRPKICPKYVYAACVARPVTKIEARKNPKAMAALNKEWDKLRNIGCWDESRVEEWSVVASRSKRSGVKVHIGLKGRVVFEGCYVKDEDTNWAIFSETASCPASMEASRAADAPGQRIEMADGESAYTQAKLGGDDTWVRLPRERWPSSWKKFQDPVCLLVLALYGHPDAGGFWEKHCDKHLKSVGFKPAHQSWMSVCFHDQLKLMLAVYVDDFKLAGPKTNLAQGWKLIGSKIKMEPPQQVGRFLGCQ
jgi:hypothetical protein